MADTTATTRHTPWRPACRPSTDRTIVLHPDGSVEVRSSPRHRRSRPSLRLHPDGSVRVQPSVRVSGSAATLSRQAA